MPIYINDQGQWKQVDDPSVNVGGNWRQVDYAFVNVGGTWEKIFSCFFVGTLILMADGSYKKLENIKEGDEIVSIDFNLPKNDWGGVNFFDLKNSMSFTKTKVIHSSFTFRDSYFDINGKRVTGDHPLFIYNKLEEVYTFERVFDIDPRKHQLVSQNYRTLPINKFQKIKSSMEVGAIGLKDYNVYIADGIIAHHNL